MGPKTWSIKDLLKVTTDYLKRKGIENPRLDAEVLLAHQLKGDRVSLYLNLDQPLTKEELSGYRTAVRRRVQREPLQYITGVQEFWSLAFRVDPRVLIPRPETELLVEKAVALCREKQDAGAPPSEILEIGTGSGAISISLAKEVPYAVIWATDISAAALDVARANAETHGVSHRITFLKGNLWDPLQPSNPRFDLILSNPPYIATDEFKELQPEVRDFEPRVALDGGEKGMSHIEHILREAPRFLSSGGWLALEMAPHQTEAALALMRQTKLYKTGSRHHDYARRYRVVMGERI